MIAELIRFGGFGPSALSPEGTEGLKQLTRYRMRLVSENSSLKNRVTAILDRLFPEYARFFDSTFSASSKAPLKKLPTPITIAAADIRTITSTLK